MINRIADETEKTIGAVILAGGLARRMGGLDKGLLEVAGKPMVQYALDSIRPYAHSLVINANRNVEQYSQFGVPVCALVTLLF